MTTPLSLFCSECGAAYTFHATSCFACNEPLAHSTSLLSAQHPLPVLPVPVVPPPTVPPGPGSLLHERYKLVREIGQGGFGVVYLAEDGQRNHRHVAVKQINIGKLSARESIDATGSYNREVTLLSKLKHPRIPRIYDHFTDPEHWYLVMDYIEGQTLEAYVQATPGYAAPEQYGKTQTSTHTDIYGLGATLQTLVTGKDPLELQTGETSVSPAPRLPKQLQLLLCQVLEKDSSKRPQNIRDVRARLEDPQRGRGRFVRPSLWGFLLGIAPYALFVVLASFTNGFVYPLLLALYCLWPFLFAGQFIAASVMLFQPRKRLVGLGILAGLALFVLALLLRQGQLSYLLSWPSFGGD